MIRNQLATRNNESTKKFSSMQSKESSGISVSVNTPPESHKSVESPRLAGSSVLASYVKGYLLLSAGICVLLVTILNCIFGVFQDQIWVHYIVNAGPFLYSVFPVFYLVEVSLKTFKHN